MINCHTRLLLHLLCWLWYCTRGWFSWCIGDCRIGASDRVGVSNVQLAGLNPARLAFLASPRSLADFVKSWWTAPIVSCNTTIKFAGGQQSKENTRTFDNYFCHSSHGTTDKTLRRTLGRKLFSFHNVHTWLLSSRCWWCTVGCSPICLFSFVLHCQHGGCLGRCNHRPAGEANLLIRPATCLKIVHLAICAFSAVPSVLWLCWLGGRKGIRPVKNLSGGVLAWLSVWSEVQLAYVPADATATHCLLLQIGFAFLVPAHLGGPGERAVKRVCVFVCVLAIQTKCRKLLWWVILCVFVRPVWVVEDWQIQKLSAERSCRPHRENSCTGATVDARLPSSEVLLSVSLQFFLWTKQS